MKIVIFRVLFWLLWPLIWLYTPLRSRARVLIVHNNQFLAVQPYFGSGRLQLPGGGIKFGESALAAATREAHEELALSLQNIKQLLPVQTYKERGLLMRYVIFFEVLNARPKPVFNREIVKIQWLPLTTSKGLSAHVNCSITQYNKAHLLK